MSAESEKILDEIAAIPDEYKIVHFDSLNEPKNPVTVVKPILVTQEQALQLRNAKNQGKEPNLIRVKNFATIESKLRKPVRLVNIYILDFVEKSYRLYPDIDIDANNGFFGEYKIDRNFVYSTNDDIVRIAMRPLPKLRRILNHPRLGVIYFKKGDYRTITTQDSTGAKIQTKEDFVRPYTREQFVAELGPEIILYDQLTGKVVTTSKGLTESDKSHIVVLKNTANSSPMLMRIIATTNLYQQWINNMDVDMKKKAVGKRWVWIVVIIAVVVVSIIVLTQTGILNGIVNGAVGG